MLVNFYLCYVYLEHVLVITLGYRYFDKERFYFIGFCYLSRMCSMVNKTTNFQINDISYYVDCVSSPFSWFSLCVSLSYMHIVYNVYICMHTNMYARPINDRPRGFLEQPCRCTQFPSNSF